VAAATDFRQFNGRSSNVKRAAGSRRAGVLLIIWSSCATAVFAQSAQPPALKPVPARADCPYTETGCPPPAAPPALESQRPEALPTGFGDAFRTIGRDFANFPTTKALSWLGAGAGLALAGTAGDRELTDDLNGKRLPVFRAGAGIGSGQAQFGLALGTFAVGRLSRNREVSALGFQLIRANLLAQALTQGIKISTHRVRPDGGGMSFPSGHSSTTFAAATVLQRRYGWKVGVPAYVLASYVAASRVNDRRHFPSDVIFGASLGVAVGLTVTRDTHRSSFLIPVATRGGVAAVWSKTW
jgi:membrane-associated phospholipid phosphatase